MRTRIYTLVALVVLGALAAACERSGGSDKKVDELEKRVAKLEAAQQKFAEIDQFVRPALERQQAQQAKEPDPNVRHAVPVAGSYSAGPADASVTLVEAFDFG